MRLNDFIKEGKVRKGEVDRELCKALIETVKVDKKLLDSIKINEVSARRLMCDYYDLLRMIIEAIAAIDGIKSYSHEAFAYYLKENKKEEVIADKFDRFRKIRNNLSYYGKTISKEEASANIKDIKQILQNLKKKYLKGVSNE